MKTPLDVTSAARPRAGGMASAPDAAPSPHRVVEVKHGKRKVDIVVEGAATVAWLMDQIETETGVMRKHQKLLCKGKQLVATETVDAQCAFKNGKTTVMLLASAGGGGAPPPPPTAGQQALAASRKAKLEALTPARATRRDASSSPEATVSSRVVAWRSTGIVGMRDMGLEAIPSEAFAIGLKARVVDASANRVAALPNRVAEWTKITRLVLTKNALTLETVDWEALTSLSNVSHLHLDENDIAGALPVSVAKKMPRLETLALDGNRIASLPSPEDFLEDADEDADDATIGTSSPYFPSLVCLSFARNRVTRIPSSLGLCARLERVDASRNEIECIPVALASAPRLKTLALDFNKRLRVEGVPPRFLRDALALDRLTLHGCAVEMETLREVDGWEAYQTRRVKRAEKALDAKVLLGENAFDEGADVERRKRH